MAASGQQQPLVSLAAWWLLTAKSGQQSVTPGNWIHCQFVPILHPVFGTTQSMR